MTQAQPVLSDTPSEVVPSLNETVIEELVPEAAARPRGVVGETLLKVRNLRTSFKLREGLVQAVTGIDFSIKRGEVLGLVGESGCGKSVTSLSIMGLIAPPGTIDLGEVVFDGQDLAQGRRQENAHESRQSHLHDLSAADVFAEPRRQGGGSDQRGAGGAPRHEQEGSDGTFAGDVANGRHTRPETAARFVSARDVRRDGSARS